jgi:hypothetical protein
MPGNMEGLQEEVRRLRNELEKERAMALLSPSRGPYRAHAGSGGMGFLSLSESDKESVRSDLPLLKHQSSTLRDGTTVFISEPEMAGLVVLS